MIAESTVKQNVMLYRMAVLSPDSIRKLRVGAVMRDRAFQSTGLAVSDAMAYADVRLEQSNERGKKVVLFNMRVPKGSNAVDVGYGEVVLPRNTEMKIIGIRREKITHYGDIYNTVIVDVEVTTP
jgi:K+/H+ antiporter YhaU regulatory subunit KhtT